MDTPSRRPAFFWFALFVCAVYVPMFAFVAYVTPRDYSQVKRAGWTVRPDNRGWLVREVDNRGAAFGQLEPGDRLLAINGDARSAIIGVANFVAVEGGSTYRVDVERVGGRRSFSLTLPVTRGRQLWPVFQLCSLVFFVCGATLALLRPDAAQVRWLSTLMMSVAFTTLLEATSPTMPHLTGWERAAHFGIVAISLWPFPMTYHVFARFPTWQPPGVPWRVVQWALYALMLFVFCPTWMVYFSALYRGGPVTDFLAAHPTLYLTAAQLRQRPLGVYFLLCLVLSVTVTTRNYRRLQDPGSRRRIRWVVASLLLACVPYSAIIFAHSLTGWISDASYDFYYPATFVAMTAIPLTFALAVWKDQLFDIRVLVRRGMQYLLARSALRALLVLPILLLAVSILSNPNRTVAQILTTQSGWLNVVLVGAIAAALQSRQRLQTSLDRRFFREAYQQERVLVELIDEVRQHDSLAEIAKLVGGRIDAVLHPKAVHIFYRAQERSETFEGHSSSQLASHQLSQQPTLLRFIDAAKAICDVPSDVDGLLPESERRWLDDLGVRLIVPITGTAERLVGVLLLGARRSDEPYSATDRRLLQGIASQIGLVYENEHLKEGRRRDADVRRDVLARLDENRVSLLKECPTCGRCYDSASDRCDQDDTELALTLPVERTLDGKYRLDRALGRGGFGAVYEAYDLRLQRLVAVKVMMGSLFGDRGALRRFEREARAAAKIDHPRITRVYDYGAVGSGGAYLVMELVTGSTWRAELQRARAIPPVRASEWFRQLLDGLQYAHAHGIVHRDLKPENVMIVAAAAGADDLKIMDFGLAKVLDEGTGATETVTAAGTTIGTLGYMAPEMLAGGLVDERADLFAVGVMVAETLTGSRPFRGATQPELLASVLRADYHLPGTTAEIRALDAVAQRCLAKDPRDRYGSAAELTRELIPLLARCPALPLAQDAAAGDASTGGAFIV